MYKKVFLIFCCLFFLTGCPDEMPTPKASDVNQTLGENLSIQEIDGHEFVVFFKPGGYGTTADIEHSPACPCMEKQDARP